MSNDPFERPMSDPDFDEKVKAATIHAAAIGRLITLFSFLEVNMFYMLIALTETSKELGLALFCDLRLDAAIKMAKRVLDARQQRLGTLPTEAPLKQVLLYVFAQIEVINGIRNLLVHHSIGTSSIFEPIASNRARSRSPDNVREAPVGPDELMKMTLDIEEANGILLLVMQPLMRKNLVDLEQALNRSRGRFVEKPWRYKSPLQGSQGNKPQSRTPKRQPQPKS